MFAVIIADSTSEMHSTIITGAHGCGAGQQRGKKKIFITNVIH